jgi:hypothetical protein
MKIYAFEIAAGRKLDILPEVSILNPQVQSSSFYPN